MAGKAEIITNRATVRAINKALKVRDITAQKFAREIGTSEASMVAWRKEGTPISKKSWEKLLPHIQPYLPSNMSTASGECAANSDYIEVIPRLAVSDLPCLRPVVQDVAEYARAHGRAFRNVLYGGPDSDCSGIFLAECPENSFGIPAGSELMCDCSKPPAPGSVVLCVQCGKAAVGRFEPPASLKIGDSVESIDTPTLLATILQYKVYL